MDLRKRTDRQIARIEETQSHYKRQLSGETTDLDDDIHKLTDLTLSIMPGSIWWHCGYISALNRAIKELKKLKKQRRNKK